MGGKRKPKTNQNIFAMKEETAKKTVFDTLSAINCNEHIEDRDGLKYLSWTWAWSIVKKLYPDASFVEIENVNGIPAFLDERLGYIVKTEVTINGETIRCMLPVMDSANHSLRDVPYVIETRKGQKNIKAADMFDINRALKRCFAKNIAYFGLGLYIYAGEDIPEEEKKNISEELRAINTFTDFNMRLNALATENIRIPDGTRNDNIQRIANLLVSDIRNAGSVDELNAIYSREAKEWWQTNKSYLELLSNRKNELKNEAA